MFHARGHDTKIGSPGLSGAGWLSLVAVSVAAPLTFSSPAQAALIASDNFQVGGTTGGSGNYTSGNISGQSSTGGTTGYYLGTASTTVNPGWEQGTGAFQATALTLTSAQTALITAPPTTNTGALVTNATGNSRGQDRAFSSVPTSTNYYFSEILEASAPGTLTGTTYAGLATNDSNGSTTPNNNGSFPSTQLQGGVQLGFNTTGLVLYYYTGTGTTTTQGLTFTQNSVTLIPLASLTTDSYVGYVSINTSTDAITATIYDGSTQEATATEAPSAASLGTTQLGTYAAFTSSAFLNTNSKVYFTDMRFGTAESDVIALSSPVPEPASCALLALGGLPLLLKRRRRV